MVIYVTMHYVGVDVSERIAHSTACVGMYGLCAHIFVSLVGYSSCSVTARVESGVVPWREYLVQTLHPPTQEPMGTYSGE